MKSRLLDILCAFIAFVAASVNAATIVDTGPGPSGITQYAPSLSPATIYPFGQFLAAEFSTGTNATVTNIEGWMSFTALGADGTTAIYSDGGDIPGTELYATTFFGTGLSNSWVGASGLSWDLVAGTYWVTFEIRPGQTLHTTMPSPSSNPLLNEAFTPAQTGIWSGFDDLNLGIRISAVPIPPAVWLFGSGLIGLVAMARRRTQS